MSESNDSRLRDNLRQLLAAIVESPVTNSLVGPGLIILGGLFEPIVPRAGLSLGGFFITGISNWSVQRRLVEQRQATQRVDSKTLIENTLKQAVRQFEATRPGKSERTLRANVMLRDDQNRLRIRYHSEGYDEDELKMTWSRGQGACGEAYQTGKTTIGPEDNELPVKVSDADKKSRPWNMSPEQIRCTAGKTGSVIAAPIRVDGRLVGVMNFDDSKCLDESLLGTPDVRAAVEGLADWAGSFLAMVGLPLQLRPKASDT